MAAGQELTPTSYIGHHLTYRTVSLGDIPSWTLRLDTLLTAVMLGVVGFGFLWWIVRGATAGVPTRRQAFVEILIQFIDDQVKGNFHANRGFVAPLALTVFVWIIFMNTIDLIPVPLPLAIRRRSRANEYHRSRCYYFDNRQQQKFSHDFPHHIRVQSPAPGRGLFRMLYQLYATNGNFRDLERDKPHPGRRCGPGNQSLSGP